MGFYLKRTVERDTPELVAWRIKSRKAGEQAHAETMQKYPEITPENFQEAVRFQERRREELMK